MFFTKYITKFRLFSFKYEDTERLIKGTWSRERAEEEDFKAGEWFELRRLSFGDSAGTNAETGSDSDNQLIKCVSLSLKRNLEEPGGLLLLGSFVLAELFLRK